MGPFGVAVDSSGNVYVTDQGNNRVQKFTSTGTYISQLGCPSGACSAGSANGQFMGPFGVAVDSSGNVYVADYGNNRVEKFTGTGTYLSQLGCPTGACSSGSGNGQFNEPSGVAVDSSGNVYVTDFQNNRVEKFTSTGLFVTKWGSLGSGDGQFDAPYGVAVDGSGNVYVADFGNDRVEKFTSTGLFVTKWGSGPGSGNGQFDVPYGVAVDGSGNVYVADSGNHRVEKFTSTGTFVTKWGSLGSGFLEGVAVDSGGNVYVTDTSYSRVELFGDSTLASVGLVAGWNLISLPLVPLNTAIGKVLAGLIAAGNFSIVWSYQGGGWKSFTPPSTGTLKTMQDGFGYLIYMSRPSTLLVLGYAVFPGFTPPTYSLLSAWNLVGFKPQVPSQNETLGTYLASISGKYVIVSVYDNLNATWIKGYPNLPLAPGEAMWIYMSTPATLVPE